jgi:hypothetical protein
LSETSVRDFILCDLAIEVRDDQVLLMPRFGREQRVIEPLKHLIFHRNSK